MMYGVLGFSTLGRLRERGQGDETYFQFLICGLSPSVRND